MSRILFCSKITVTRQCAWAEHCQAASSRPMKGKKLTIHRMIKYFIYAQVIQVQLNNTTREWIIATQYLIRRHCWIHNINAISSSTPPFREFRNRPRFCTASGISSAKHKITLCLPKRVSIQLLTTKTKNNSNIHNNNDDELYHCGDLAFL